MLYACLDELRGIGRGGGIVSSGVLLRRLVCRLVLGEELVRLVVSSRRHVVMLSCRLAFRLVWSSRPCVSWCSSRGVGVGGGEALLACPAVSLECCSHCHLSYLWRLVVVIIV